MALVPLGVRNSRFPNESFRPSRALGNPPGNSRRNFRAPIVAKTSVDAVMRPRRLVLPCLALWLAVAAGGNPVRAAEVDAEDYRMLKARVASFDEFVAQNNSSLKSLRNELARLRSENDALRTQAAAARGAVSQDQLSRLATQVQEVERNRGRDKQQVLDAIDRLKNYTPPAAPVAKTPVKKVPAKKAPVKKTPAKKAPVRKPSSTTNAPAANPGVPR